MAKFSLVNALTSRAAGSFLKAESTKVRICWEHSIVRWRKRSEWGKVSTMSSLAERGIAINFPMVT
ncbi:UNVERIFIED_CONTAM: hypothetical protein GTU68_004634 [Idotea baltica]|nr:hypothetical protein [Idotea baltica]